MMCAPVLRAVIGDTILKQREQQIVDRVQAVQAAPSCLVLNNTMITGVYVVKHQAVPQMPPYFVRSV